MRNKFATIEFGSARFGSVLCLSSVNEDPGHNQWPINIITLHLAVQIDKQMSKTKRQNQRAQRQGKTEKRTKNSTYFTMSPINVLIKSNIIQ